MAIVTILELRDGGAHFFDVSEDAAVNGLLLQGAVEALDDAIGAGSQLRRLATFRANVSE